MAEKFLILWQGDLLEYNYSRTPTSELFLNVLNGVDLIVKLFIKNVFFFTNTGNN